METFVYVVFAIVVLALLAVIVVLSLRPRKVEIPDIKVLEQKLLYALASQTSIREIQEILKGMPRDVMQSITGSLSKRTGKLNELMATFELTHYDRLFYLGEPIDFVGIKYDEGVDFIEVKTGRFRLTEDEKKLRELIESGRVNYVPLSVERIGLAEELDTEEG
ncbi:MAG: Holliday junction resolvase-like protein [Dehalococcoidia bacterium]